MSTNTTATDVDDLISAAEVCELMAIDAAKLKDFRECRLMHFPKPASAAVDGEPLFALSDLAEWCDYLRRSEQARLAGVDPRYVAPPEYQTSEVGK